MLSRCPNCQTTFRVTTEQLKARLGQVRCGTCKQVFNALEALVDALPDTQSLAPPAPVWRDAAAAPLARPDSFTNERSFHSLLSKEVSSDLPLAQAANSANADIEEFTSDAFESIGSSDEAPDEALPLQPPIKLRRWPWAIAASLAGIVFIAQIAVYYRIEIAVLSPEARPALEALCEVAMCSVDLPSKVELLSIEASDLHPVDPATPTQLELTATLRNRAPFAQTWPHLELTITDTTDNAVARRVIAPQEYLLRGRDATSGFASQSDNPVSIFLTTAGLPASGYRLYLFYP
ncbi:MAG: DUF3426 domain-containing protein [Rhodocyclaceae bacterium]|nr:DUF3426 domain-containing protein [Rhodocyclaceae bacterium]